MNERLNSPRQQRLGVLAALMVLATAAAAACSSTSKPVTGSTPETTQVLCSDGIDNDNDGKTDCQDPNCAKYCAGDVSQGDTHKDVDASKADVSQPDSDTTTDADADASSSDAIVMCQFANGFGCKCTQPTDCDSGYCVDTDDGKMCSQTCGDCPTDWKCIQASANDPAYICLPAWPNLCMPCNDHKDCQLNGVTDSYCVPFDEGSGQQHGFINGHFCMAACIESTDPSGKIVDTCKSGYQCESIKLFADAAPLKQCVPISQTCDCTLQWSQAGQSTECHKTSLSGTCTSTRQCQVDANGQPVLTICGAPDPVTEVCGDNVDNDCNGLTDEPGALGCHNYYVDNDGDGFGQGATSPANCLCNDPGQGYAPVGGDCNDFSKQIHPGAPEICNNIDDNCNGLTDEAGAQGCTVYYHDLDGDGYGNNNDSACMCKSKATSEWILQSGDCDDTPGSGALIHPGVDEVCDGVDNNCNGKTDEQGAIGCKLYYVDQDNDTYGVTTSGLCLCAPTKANSAAQPGDCDDSNPAINPAEPEICDGIDNNCDGVTDGKDADSSCPLVDNGNPKCLPGGICGVGGCAKGSYDLNNDPSDGCECKDVSSVPGLGAFCGVPIDAGIMGDGGSSTQKAGQILPGEGGDWYKFNATDSPDNGTSSGGNCDQYDVHISFVLNPNNIFVFDVFRGSCANIDQVCQAETVHDWSTSFYGGAPFGPKNKANSNSLGTYQKSPVPEIAGECNCVPANAVLKPCTPSTNQSDPQNDPDLKGCGPNSLPGMNICSDNSAWYYVRVYTKPGAALTCDQYIIQFNNGYAAGTIPPNN